jgi:hypothetical protein
MPTTFPMTHKYIAIALLLVITLISSFLIILGKGEFAAKALLKAQDAKFAQQSRYHKIAIEAFRDCYQLPFDSRSICIQVSIDISQKSGLSNTEELTIELLKYTKPDSRTMIDTLKLGWRETK